MYKLYIDNQYAIQRILCTRGSSKKLASRLKSNDLGFFSRNFVSSVEGLLRLCPLSLLRRLCDASLNYFGTIRFCFTFMLVEVSKHCGENPYIGVWCYIHCMCESDAIRERNNIKSTNLHCILRHSVCSTCIKNIGLTCVHNFLIMKMERMKIAFPHPAE